LALPLSSLIHNVFHVSMLKKHVGPVTTISIQLPPVTDEANILPQPEIVLDRRVIQKGQYHLKVEVLIKWKGASEDDATWEDERRLAKSYPAFPCGQGILRGEIDMFIPVERNGTWVCACSGTRTWG